MDPSTMLGPIDELASIIEYVVFVLIIVNMATRHLQHSRHKSAVKAGAESLARHPAHIASNVLLLLASMYLLTVDYHGGFVLGVLVIGLIITDFFEFESRQVELRTDGAVETPRAAIFASGLVLLYAFYLSLFFLLSPVWEVIF